LKATTHQPCLYSGTYDGNKILFLRQVDDFAIARNNETIAKLMIQEINSFMSVQIKYLGLLTRYNSVDIDQTSQYIKLFNKTYVQKILEGQKNWMPAAHCHIFPMPMKSENAYIHQLEQAITPITDRDKTKLQSEMKFNYCQVIGELIYAMVTCRPDISFPVIKLSQSSMNPAQEHYTAVSEILQYLKCTDDKGIYFWRPAHHKDYPEPTTSHDNKPMDVDATIQDKPTLIQAASDSDWGGDTKHQKSLTGFVRKMAGGCIYYKSKFQPTITLSLTEAEFVAATEAGKAILYVKTMLEEIGIEQKFTTTLYIDNNGALNMANQQQPTHNT
jgi:hypothetical protein